MKENQLKRIAIIAFIIIIVIAVTSCTTKSDIAPLQQNGLNYSFVGYVGPDSCLLYRCAYHEDGYSYAGQIFITICKNQKVTDTDWIEQHGKHRDYCHNSVIQQNKDTIVNMPETTYVQTIKMVPMSVPAKTTKK